MEGYLATFGEFMQVILTGTFDLLKRFSVWLASIWNLSLIGQILLFLLLILIIVLIFQVVRNRINFLSEQKYAYQPLNNRRLSVVCAYGVTIQFISIFGFFLSKKHAMIGAGAVLYLIFLGILYLYWWNKLGARLSFYALLWVSAFIQLFSVTIYIMILYFRLVEEKGKQTKPPV